MVRSALRSAAETKSAGPLRETCSCSTSPKSRLSPRAAFSAARIMTLMAGDRTAMRRDAALLRALDVAAVFGVHHDARARLDMRRDQDAAAIVELAGLVRGGGGLALHDGVGLDD